MKIQQPTATLKQYFGFRPMSFVTAQFLFVLLGAIAPVIVEADEMEKRGLPKILEVGPHSRKIEQVWAVRGIDGTQKMATNSFVEIAGGLNRWDGLTWIPSQALFEKTTTGFVVARSGQQQVILSDNLQDQPAIDLLTASGTRVRSRPIALALLNTETGDELIIAEVQGTKPEVISDNEVLYRDAFKGTSADYRIKLTLDSFEADVILREKLTLPEGFSSKSTILEVITQFFDDPTAVTALTKAETDNDTGTSDQTLTFGDLIIGGGHAFDLDSDSGNSDEINRKVGVKKRWEKFDQGRYLLERVGWQDLTVLTDNLPASGKPRAAVTQKWRDLAAMTSKQKAADIDAKESGTQTALNPSFKRDGSGKWALTLNRATVQSSHGKPIGSYSLAAANKSKRPGVVLDYTAVTSVPSFLLQSDVTYFVSGYLSIANLTVEGGTVVKYDNSASKITVTSTYVNSPLVPCTMYHPAVFTGVYDNTVGSLVATSASPPAYYGSSYLEISAIGTTIQNIKIRSAATGIRYVAVATASNAPVLRHVQLVNCANGIRLENTGPSNPITLTAGNILMANVPVPFYLQPYGSFVAENCTFNQITTLVDGSYSAGGATIKNSVMAYVTANCLNGMSIGGNNNGFFRPSPAPVLFGTSTYTASSTPFETAGGGQFYLTTLATGGQFQDKGTTTINAALLADLKLRTTAKPTVMDSYTITSTDLWSVSVPRDNNSTPDLGYHYAPLDRLIFGTTIDGPTANVTLGAGLAVGVYGYAGFVLNNQATLCSQGTPDAPVQLCYFNEIQEQSTYGTMGNTCYFFGAQNGGGLQLQFTRCDFLAGGTFYHIYTSPSAWAIPNVSVRDSFFMNGAMLVSGLPGNKFFLNNNLLSRVSSTLSGQSSLFVFNNLFYGGNFDDEYDPGYPAAWTVSGNIFDNCVIWPDVDPVSHPHSYNAYVGSPAKVLTPFDSATEKQLASLVYASGKYGNFYQPANSSLVDAEANKQSSARSLDYYTVLAAYNTKDTGMLDIGLHYPGVDASGQVLTSAGIPAIMNMPPTVDVGPDFPASTARFKLHGNVFDDGRGCSQFLVLTWSKTSGAGSASFETQGTPDTYVNVGLSGTYTFQLTANDGSYTAWDQVTVTVSSVIGPPVVTTSTTPMIYVEGSNNEPVDPAISISDPDSLRLSKLTVQITGGYVVGQDILSLPLTAGTSFAARFTVSAFDTAAGKLTINAVGGTALVADFKKAAQLVQYSNGSGIPATAIRTVTFAATDEQGASGTATRTITVQATNRLPKVDAGPPQSSGPGNPPAVTLAGKLTPLSDQDGDVLIYKWTLVSGPTSVTFNPALANTLQTTATFSQNGRYTFRLTVTDGQKTDWDETTVDVCNGYSYNYDVAIVLDTSGSMGGDLKTVKESIKQFIEILLNTGGENRIAIIPFNDEVCSRQQLTSNKSQLYSFIEAIQPGGDENLGTAIEAAGKELWSSRARTSSQMPRKVLLVISDGFLTDVNGFGQPFTDANVAATHAKETGIKVVCASVPTAKDWPFQNKTFLDTLASPGASLPAYAMAELSANLITIASDSCNLTAPSSPLNVSKVTLYYPPSSAEILVCDTFLVLEDSQNNILDVFANDDYIPPSTPSDWQYTFSQPSSAVLGSQNSSQSPSRITFHQGTFEIVLIDQLPKLKFTPAPGYFTTGGLPTYIDNGEKIEGTYAHGTAAAGSFRVVVMPVDDPPKAIDDNFTISKPGSYTDLDVIANDSNVDRGLDPIEIVSVGPVTMSDGSPSVDQAEKFGVGPDNKNLEIHYFKNQTAPAYQTKFTYTISDKHKNLSTATVNVKVVATPSQAAPQAKADEFTIPVGVVATVAASDLLANDTNPNMDGTLADLTVILSGSHPANVTQSGNVITVDTRAQPPQDLVFAYQAVNLLNLPTAQNSTPATVTIHLTGKADPLMAVDDYVPPVYDPPALPIVLGPTIPVSTPNVADPRSNDVPAGFNINSVNIKATTGTMLGGTLTRSGGQGLTSFGTGVFSFTPNATFKGTTQLDYEVQYPDGVVSKAKVVLNIKRTFGSNPNNHPPVAAFTTPAPLLPAPPSGNLQPPGLVTQTTITDGKLQVSGVAYDPDIVDAVNYTVEVFRYSSQIIDFSQPQVPVASYFGQRPAGSTSASVALATFDLTALPNGVYEIQLTVNGGGEDSLPATTRFALQSDLKLGRVQYTESDYSLTVAGVPFTIQRSYDSLDANAQKEGEFGFGWRNALTDLQMEVAETRTSANSLDGLDAFSLRTGGSRDITLTLPDGRRRTFFQTFKSVLVGSLSAFQVVYNNPPDVPGALGQAWQPGRTTLEAINNGYAATISGITGRWIPNGQTDFETYDLPGFSLQTPDGNIYTFQRENYAYQTYLADEIGESTGVTTASNFEVQCRGNPRLSSVTLPSGELIEIDSDGVRHRLPDASHTITRAFTYDRDGTRIKAIYAPGITANPVVRYDYDSTGNLVTVSKLTADSALNPVYTKTTYQYTDPNNPFLLTGIVDSTGIQILLNEYDDAGRLLVQRGANGEKTRFDRIDKTSANTSLFKHTLSIGREVRTQTSPPVLQPGGSMVPQPIATELFEYDGAGNIVYEEGAAGLPKTRTFGPLNQLIKEEYTVPGQGPSGAAVQYTREWAFADPVNPLLPTQITAPFAAGTVANKKRITRLEYNAAGMPLRRYDPEFPADNLTHYDFAYDPVQPTWLIGSSFTGVNPAVTAKPLSTVAYNTTAGSIFYGKIQTSKDAENNWTVNAYYDIGEPGGRLGDLKSVATYPATVANPLLPGSSKYTRKTSYSYDANGNLATQTQWRYKRDENGGFLSGEDYLTTSLFYDSLGRVIKVSDPVFDVAANTQANQGTCIGSETKYNSRGFVSSTVDRFNNTTRYFYDHAGRKSCVVYPDGTLAFTAVGYGANERYLISEDTHAPLSVPGTPTTGALSVIDSASRAIRSERLSTVIITESTSGAVSGPSPSADLICDVTAADWTILSSSRTEYFADGRVSKSIDPMNRVTTYQYSGDELQKTTLLPVYADGSDSLTTWLIEDYDRTGNLMASQTKTYRNNNVLPTPTITLEAIRPVTKYVYDQLSRRRETWNFSDETAVTGTKLLSEDYDYNNRRIRSTDGDNVKTRFDYDDRGQMFALVAAETQSETTTTTFAFDEYGRQLSQTDALTRKTKFEYDALGRRTKRIQPDGSLNVAWTYDVLQSGDPVLPANKKHNAILQVDQGGRQIISMYDSMGRLTDQKNGSTTLLNIQYNENGLRWKVKDTFTPTGTYVEYLYDGALRLFQKKQPFSASVTAILTYDYFADGKVKSVQSDLGTTAAYAYDGRGRLSKVYDFTTYNSGTEPEAAYTYDAVGNLKTVTYPYPNLVQSTYEYNTRNQLRRVRAAKTTSQATMIANFDYDEAGTSVSPGAGGTWSATQRLSVSGSRNRMIDSVGGVSRTVDYVHDKLHRLSSETITATAGGGVINYAGNSGYDAVGNRRSRISSVTGVANTPANVNYDVDDQLDNDTNPANPNTAPNTWFDSNGNTMKADLDGNGTISTAENANAYTYDVQNRLTGVSPGGITMSYDAEGNRVKKTTSSSTTYYLVDTLNPTGFAQVIEERSTPTAISVIYLYGLDLVRQSRSSGTTYYGYDGLGSVRYLTGPSGTASDTYTYDAFGIQLSSAGSMANSYRYTGEQWDADLQMYYLRARYYIPGSGRFLNMDTFAGIQTEPLSLHKYLYTRANPVNGVDPSGHDIVEMVSGLANKAILWTMSATRGARVFRAATAIAGAHYAIKHPGEYMTISGSFGVAPLAWEIGELYSAGRAAVMDLEAMQEAFIAAEQAAKTKWWDAVRNTFGVKANQNVAIASYNFKGVKGGPGKMFAVSGRDSYPGTVDVLPNSHFTTTSVGTGTSIGAWSRKLDTESKLLEWISQMILQGNREASGSILIQTQLTECSSCQGVIDQFNLMYPNVQLKIESAMSKLPR